MLRLMKRHEIQVLLRAHHSQKKVAELAGVSISSVRRVGEEEPVEHDDDAAEHTKRRIGRPSVVQGVRKLVQATLKARPDLDAVQMLHRALLAGYRGGDAPSTTLSRLCGRRPGSLCPRSKSQRPRAPRMPLARSDWSLNVL